MPDSIGNLAASLGGGFFGGILIGYALKKVVKLAAVIIGIFFAGLAYLQYQQILSVNWNKLQGHHKTSYQISQTQQHIFLALIVAIM
jgi:uncharacterized membrane protein (Fun14 family)